VLSTRGLSTLPCGKGSPSCNLSKRLPPQPPQVCSPGCSAVALCKNCVAVLHCAMHRRRIFYAGMQWLIMFLKRSWGGGAQEQSIAPDMKGQSTLHGPREPPRIRSIVDVTPGGVRGWIQMGWRSPYAWHAHCTSNAKEKLKDRQCPQPLFGGWTVLQNPLTNPASRRRRRRARGCKHWRSDMPTLKCKYNKKKKR